MHDVEKEAVMPLFLYTTLPIFVSTNLKFATLFSI